jgi:hypothetical protein
VENATGCYNIIFLGCLCLCLCLSIYLWFYCPLLDIENFLSFLILYTIGRTSWRSEAVLLPTHRTINTQTQTSMPWEGFEPTLPAFERAKIAAKFKPISRIGIRLVQCSENLIFMILYDFCLLPVQLCYVIINYSCYNCPPYNTFARTK